MGGQREANCRADMGRASSTKRTRPLAWVRGCPPSVFRPHAQGQGRPNPDPEVVQSWDAGHAETSATLGGSISFLSRPVPFVVFSIWASLQPT